ncbi:MAG: C-type lectin domain-containing protein [Deltaproteobacteria bacterium]|nr:MAG: C-type lectin domain-containing protein [Deltaproteobacteria bacterium]
MRWLVVLAVTGGCGRLGFGEEHARLIDASVDAVDLTIDARVTKVDPCAATYTTKYLGSSYKLYPAAPWLDAVRRCEQDGRGTHLLLIDDSFEAMTVKNLASGATIWIGISDRTVDNYFLKVTGQVAYTGQGPSPALPGPGCIDVDESAGTAHEVSCDMMLSFVCECDFMPADPASY